MKHAARTVSLGLVIACTVVTFGLGVAQKAPCASGDWNDGKQYRLLCYTDVVPLLGTEQLDNGRLPFLNPCRHTDFNCDEYPVLTMYLLRATAWVSGIHYASFYFVNAFVLGVCAVVIAFCLWRMAGRRALWFALAPTLLLYGTMNWDLFAVALATAALLAFAARQDEWSGAFLGLGAAAKFFPALLVPSLLFQGLRDREPDRSVRIIWWSVGSWAATNLPFAIVAMGAWWEFFRFNAKRIPDFDSAWYLACDHHLWCPSVKVVNTASAGLFVTVVAVVWWWKRRRTPAFSRWTLGLPILVAFLLVNKVYSPQYGLWLLPWFALVLTDARWFVAFELTDVAVFLTRFRYFGSLPPLSAAWGWPAAWLQWADAARWLVLVAILVHWVRTEPLPLALGTGGWRRRAPVPPPPPAPQEVFG